MQWFDVVFASFLLTLKTKHFGKKTSKFKLTLTALTWKQSLILSIDDAVLIFMNHGCRPFFYFEKKPMNSFSHFCSFDVMSNVW